jgi:hypothetical protein
MVQLREAMTLRGIFLLVLMIMVVAGLCVRMAFYARLRFHHDETWQKLGKPTALNNTINTSIKSFRYLLMSSDYRSLNDGILSRYVIAERMQTLANLAVLGVGFALQFTGHL